MRCSVKVCKERSQVCLYGALGHKTSVYRWDIHEWSYKTGEVGYKQQSSDIIEIKFVSKQKIRAKALKTACPTLEEDD